MEHTLTYSVEKLVPYIHWPYFFHAWQFPARFANVAGVHGCQACRQAWIGKQPAEDRLQAQAASQLYDEAVEMLQRLATEGVVAQARFSILPCRGAGDDLLFEDTWYLPCMRQQKEGGTCLCLSDFVLPQDAQGGDGVNNKVGLFATAVHCLHPDDMLQQTLCDRLAEAAAEMMHLEVRRTYWGYSPDEELQIPDLHAEKFQGIRPAVGYPCLPDQRVIFIINRHLHMEKIGISLTENGAMQPHAATCGLMFAHPASRYFAVGEISQAQSADYESRFLKYNV